MRAWQKRHIGDAVRDRLGLTDIASGLHRVERRLEASNGVSRAADVGAGEKHEGVGVPELLERFDRIETRLQTLTGVVLSSREELWERSRKRWRGDELDADLTWGVVLTGDAFIDAALDYRPSPERVLEIGPGYGRLLQSLLERCPSIRTYVGVDLSEGRVGRLRGQFDDARVAFVHGDVESVTFDAPFDLIVSSLTFKHLYPDFSGAARNLRRSLTRDGWLVFDVLEGHHREFQTEHPDTFLHWYERDEIESLLQEAGYAGVDFGVVSHAPGYERLLVAARLA